MKTKDKKEVRLHLTNIAGLGAIRLTESLLPSLLQSPNYTVEEIYLPSHNKFFNLLSAYKNIILLPYKRYLPNSISRVLECTIFSRKFNGKSPLLVMGDIPLRVKCDQTVFIQSSLLTNGSKSRSIKYLIARLLFKINLKFAKHFIVQTEVMKAAIINTYPEIKNKIHVIAQPAPSWLIESKLIRNQRITENNKLSFFYPAANYPHKNHQLLSGIQNTDAHNWPITEMIFTIPEKEHPNHSIAWIKCVDHLNSDQVIENYKKADALLFLSKAESLGFPLIEAMWIGLPIICPDLPYARILCGDQAFYFNPDDVNSLKEAIINLQKKLQLGWWPNWKKNLESVPMSWEEVANDMLQITTRGKS